MCYLSNRNKYMSCVYEQKLKFFTISSERNFLFMLNIRVLMSSLERYPQKRCRRIRYGGNLKKRTLRAGSDNKVPNAWTKVKPDLNWCTSDKTGPRALSFKMKCLQKQQHIQHFISLSDHKNNRKNTQYLASHYFITTAEAFCFSRYYCSCSKKSTFNWAILFGTSHQTCCTWPSSRTIHASSAVCYALC